MSPSPSRVDQSLTLVVLAMLIIGCFFVLQPFITALVWAAVLCTTTWPLYLRLAARLRNRDGLAAFAMVLLLAVIMLTPFVVVGATIADNAAVMARWGRDLLAADFSLPNKSEPAILSVTGTCNSFAIQMSGIPSARHMSL